MKIRSSLMFLIVLSLVVNTFSEFNTHFKEKEESFERYLEEEKFITDAFRV
jgi:hypothetical protein